MIQYNSSYFEIVDANKFIRFTAFELAFPNATEEWDKDWIKAETNVKSEVFSGKFIADFRITELEQFKQQLGALNDNLKGSVIFNPLEKQLVLDIRGDGLGHFEVSCTVKPTIDEILRFSLFFDQTQINELVNQLNQITTTLVSIEAS